MILGLANSLFRLFREHSDVVSVDKLKKDGVRSVTVLDWSRIDQLIAKAVDEALKKRGVELPPDALASVNQQAREAFARLLEQRDQWRDSAQTLEQQKNELEANLNRLVTELDTARSQLDREKTHRVTDADVAVSRARMDSFALRLKDGLVDLFKGSPAGASPELARAAAELAEHLLADEKARALADAKRDQDARIDLLERRIAKLNGMLENSDRLVERLKAAKTIDPGIESEFREVQGLSVADSNAGAKRGLLEQIFKLNVELREAIGKESPQSGGSASAPR
jgi:exonuclease VII large subunit